MKKLIHGVLKIHDYEGELADESAYFKTYTTGFGLTVEFDTKNKMTVEEIAEEFSRKAKKSFLDLACGNDEVFLEVFGDCLRK